MNEQSNVSKMYDTIIPILIYGFELESFSGELGERVQQNPVNSNGKYSLYLKFSEATTYVLRIIVIYRCQRYLQINSSRNCFKSHELEQ